jgi:RNA polymerase sigma-70 factor (ECF subfamily)
MDEARRAVEHVARESFGKLVAFLSARSGDVAGAEDALADALLAALRRWPIDGIPDLPEAWLIRVARRRLIDAGRRGRFRDEVLRALHHEANRSSPPPPPAAPRPPPAPRRSPSPSPTTASSSCSSAPTRPSTRPPAPP